MPIEQVSAIPAHRDFLSDLARMRAFCAEQEALGWPQPELKEPALLFCPDLWCRATNKEAGPVAEFWEMQTSESARAFTAARAIGR